MQRQPSFGFRVAVCAAALLPLSLFVSPRPADAYTPESPEVQRAIARAVAYLKTEGVTDRRVGGKALIGLALVKAGADRRHAKIAEAVEAIRTRLGNNDPSQYFAAAELLRRWGCRWNGPFAAIRIARA